MRRHLPLILILLLGTALRIPLLLVRGTLSFDELFSVHFATIPSLSDTIRYWILETNPPLYTLFLRGYLAIVGTQSEFLIRFPSLLFAILSMIMLFLLGKRLWGAKDASFATLLIALSQIHIFISSEARTYSLLVLLTVTSAYLFYRIYHDHETSRWLFASSLVIDTCLLYAHLTGLTFLAAQYIALSVFRSDRRFKRLWLAIHGLSGLLFLPWLLPSALLKFHTNLSAAWYFHPALYVQNSNLFTLFLSGFSLNFGDAITTTVVSLLLVAGFVAVIRMAHTQEHWNERILFLVLWGGLPIAASSMLGVYISKYLVGAHLALFLLAGHVLATCCNRKKKTIFTSVALLFLLLPATIETAFTPVFSSVPSYRFMEMHETPRTIVLAPITELLLMERYYHGHASVIPLSFIEKNMPRDERIVRENWLLQPSSESAERAFLERVLTERHPDRIYLIEGYQPFDIIHNELTNRGWTQLTVPNPYRGMKFNLTEFSAPRSG